MDTIETSAGGGDFIGEGVAVVEKVAGTSLLRLSVCVTFTRPSPPDPSFLRCSEDDAPIHCRAGALSGARYARHAVDPHRFGIEVRGISGSLESPESAEGAAVAAMFATWIAGGHRWSEAEAQANAWGWTLVTGERRRQPPDGSLTPGPAAH